MASLCDLRQTANSDEDEEDSHSPCMWSRCRGWSGWRWPLSAAGDIVLHPEPGPAASDWPPADQAHLHTEDTTVRKYEGFIVFCFVIFVSGWVV